MKLFSIRRLIVFGAGAAAGYFLGSREGRKQAEAMARQAQEFWTDPKTQQQVHDVAGKVTDVVKEKAPQLSEVADKAAEFVDKSTGYAGSNDDTGTAKTASGTENAEPDTVSDPSTDPANEGPADK